MPSEGARTPVAIPRPTIKTRRSTPITLRGSLPIISEAIKIPKGAPKRPNIVINCEVEVSKPKSLSIEGIQFIRVY